jgi:predicted amidohydrolase
MDTRKFVAAALQICAGDDVAANLTTCRRLATDAARAGASLLVLPECFAFIGLRMRDRFAIAETIDAERPGPILAAVLEMARDNQLWVIAGGMPEIPPKDTDTDADADKGELSRTYNTCVTVSPGGEITALYRKIHLFDVNIPGRAVLMESENTGRGRDIVIASTDLARIGLSICYDLRFPELYRELVLRLGAQILVVPAAFTAHTGAAHWHTLLRARAIENQCYVIAAAQTGRHNDKRESYGHTLIIDPWGTVLGERADGEGLVMADIDLDQLDERRAQMPCLEHQVLLR